MTLHHIYILEAHPLDGVRAFTQLTFTDDAFTRSHNFARSHNFELSPHSKIHCFHIPSHLLSLFTSLSHTHCTNRAKWVDADNVSEGVCVRQAKTLAARISNAEVFANASGVPRARVLVDGMDNVRRALPSLYGTE